jgi:hypothetical protein
MTQHLLKSFVRPFSLSVSLRVECSGHSLLKSKAFANRSKELGCESRVSIRDEYINLPVSELASRRSLGLEYQSSPQGPTNSPSMTRDVGPALLAIAGYPIPDGINDILKEIAARYSSASEQEMSQSRTFTKRGDLWHYGELVVVPEVYNLRRRCISINHDLPSAGHPGRDVTLELVQRQFWWPSIRRDVSQYVASCISYQSNKVQKFKPAGLLRPLPVPDYPWQSVSMDLITHLPCTARGHTAIVVFVDTDQNGSLCP